MKIEGFCPMGCGETLHASQTTMLIECFARRCPDPVAVSKILGVEETEHVLVVRDDGWFTLMHPLRERVGEGLFECEVGSRLREAAPPKEKPGRFRVTVHEPDAYSESYRPDSGGLDFERIE